MDSIVRAALAAGGPGRATSFRKMGSQGAAAEQDPPEPPASPSPTVRFASPVAIPLGDKDELARSRAAATGAGDDVEVGWVVTWCLLPKSCTNASTTSPTPPPNQAPAPPPADEGRPDYMAMTVSSLSLLGGDRLRAGWSQNADLTAMALIGFSAFIYSLQTLNVKFLGGRFDSWTSTLFRGVVGTTLCMIDALFFKPHDSYIWGKPENRRMLLLRGFLGGLTIASAFFAVQAMDLAEASVLIFTAPLWTAVLSNVMGVGAWGMADSCSAIACLIGMMMVTQPPFLVGGRAPGESTSFIGVVAALFSAVTAAGVNITISKLKGEPASTITLYAMIGSIIVAFPGFCYHQLGPHGRHGLWHASKDVIAQLCLTGVLSTIAQLTKTSGLKMSKSFGVLVMRYLDIFFAFIWDAAFLHAEQDALSICGALIIVGGCMASILLKKGGG